MTLDPCTVCETPAAWKCAGCGAKCAEHVRRRRGTRVLFRCGECGKDAELLRRRRAELHTFQERARLALLGPLAGPRVLLATVAVAFVFFTITVLGFVGVLLGGLVAVVLGIRLVRAVAESAEFEWPAPGDAMEQVLMPFARALATTVLPVIALWIGVYLKVVSPYDVAVEHPHSLATTLVLHPSFWLASAFAILVTPLALLQAAVQTEWGPLFNPLRALAPARTFPREYGLITAFAGVGFLVTFAARWVLPVGLVGNLVAAVLASWSVFATFRLLGELLWLNPEPFGWGDADEGWVELGDAGRPVFEEPAPEKAAPAPAVTKSLEAQVSAALDNKDVPTVVRLWKQSPGIEAQLAPATLLRTGQAAASVNEHAVALAALLAAAAGETPEAAKALVIAARILDERLGDQDGAKRLYNQVVQRFEGTQAADYARKQLADPRFFLSRKA